MSDQVSQAGWDLLNEYEPILGESSKASLDTKKAFRQMKDGAAISELATKKLGADWAANKATRPSKTNEEFHADRREVIRQAAEAHREGLKQIRDGYEQIRSTLRSEVLPKVTADREMLDRQLFDLQLGAGDGAKTGSRALRIAQSKDETLKAVLVSPYGQARLKTAGVHERTISDVTDLIVATSDHPSAKVAARIGRLEAVLVALDTSHRQKVKNR